jgi:predicted small lipoprotein YifL
MRRRVNGVLVVLTIAGACGGAGPVVLPDEDRCPLLQSEFPPTDCAIVEGVAVNAQGNVLGGLPIMVDSAIASVGFAYTSASGSTTTDVSGRFRFVVFRVNRLKPRTVPDTATVEIKAYDQRAPRAGDIAIARAPVLMRFAELGAVVERTQVTARFDLD